MPGELDFDTFVIDHVTDDGVADSARLGILMYIRHKRTRVPFDLRFRIAVTVRDGKVVRVEEHHDAARVYAWMEYARAQEIAGPGGAPEQTPEG